MLNLFKININKKFTHTQDNIPEVLIVDGEGKICDKISSLPPGTKIVVLKSKAVDVKSILYLKFLKFAYWLAIGFTIFLAFLIVSSYEDDKARVVYFPSYIVKPVFITGCDSSLYKQSDKIVSPKENIIGEGKVWMKLLLLRDGPSLNSSVIGKMKKFYKVEILEEKKVNGKIRYKVYVPILKLTGWAWAGGISRIW